MQIVYHNRGFLADKMIFICKTEDKLLLIFKKYKYCIPALPQTHEHFF
jgi:hypothetical protein